MQLVAYAKVQRITFSLKHREREGNFLLTRSSSVGFWLFFFYLQNQRNKTRSWAYIWAFPIEQVPLTSVQRRLFSHFDQRAAGLCDFTAYLQIYTSMKAEPKVHSTR